MKILLGITGSISAYKAPDIISGLLATNNEVKVIATNSALKFITELSLATIAKNKIYTSKTDELDGTVPHIDLAEWCDVFLCSPASANTISKFATGASDNILTDTYLALTSDKRKIIAPAMNTNMWNNSVTQENVEKLKKLGCEIIDPAEGLLACGVKGKGKLPKPRTIVKVVNEGILSCE